MKIALMSDIHANMRAFEACLADASKEGVSQYAFLGDLVGYGAEPSAVVDRVMQMAEKGAWVLKGNHDDMAVFPPIAEGRALGDQGVAWTHNQLSPPQIDFLKNLPLTHTEGTIYLVHASALQPEKWSYVHDVTQAERSLNAACLVHPNTRYLFGGHVHHQALYYRGNGRGLMAFNPTAGVPVPMPSHRFWVATVGSVGQPRDKKVQAGYAIFDNVAQKMVFRRIPYDHVAAAEAIRAAGLPGFYADRLALGQ